MKKTKKMPWLDLFHLDLSYLTWLSTIFWFALFASYYGSLYYFSFFKYWICILRIQFAGPKKFTLNDLFIFSKIESLSFALLSMICNRTMDSSLHLLKSVGLKLAVGMAEWLNSIEKNVKLIWTQFDSSQNDLFTYNNIWYTSQLVVCTPIS